MSLAATARAPIAHSRAAQNKRGERLARAALRANFVSMSMAPSLQAGRLRVYWTEVLGRSFRRCGMLYRCLHGAYMATILDFGRPICL
jgi:hypothetical protein